MSNIYPHEISEKFQEVYKKYFENNSDPKTALTLIDQFLEKVPLYPEALIFKARMLLVPGKNRKALKTIALAEKYDKWRLLGKFDKAEAYLENNETKRSISEFINAINLYQNELQNGVESYLVPVRKQQTELNTNS